MVQIVICMYASAIHNVLLKYCPAARAASGLDRPQSEIRVRGLFCWSPIAEGCLGLTLLNPVLMMECPGGPHEGLPDFLSMPLSGDAGATPTTPATAIASSGGGEVEEGSVGWPSSDEEEEAETVIDDDGTEAVTHDRGGSGREPGEVVEDDYGTAVAGDLLGPQTYDTSGDDDRRELHGHQEHHVDDETEAETQRF